MATTMPKTSRTTITKTVTGNQAQLTAYLTALTARGDLVSLTTPQQTEDGSYRMTVQLATGPTRPATTVATTTAATSTVATYRPQAAASYPTTARAVRPGNPERTFMQVFICIVTALILGIVACLFILVGDLVRFVQHDGVYILGALVLLAAICGGVGTAIKHCPGCRG